MNLFHHPPARPFRLEATARSLLGSLLLASLLLSLPAIPVRAGTVQSVTGQTLPEFMDKSPQAWINSPPMTAEQMKGQVWLVEVWTSI